MLLNSQITISHTPHFFYPFLFYQDVALDHIPKDTNLSVFQETLRFLCK